MEPRNEAGQKLQGQSWRLLLILAEEDSLDPLPQAGHCCCVPHHGKNPDTDVINADDVPEPDPKR